MKLEKDDAKIGILVFLALAVFAGFIFRRGVSALLTKETPYEVALAAASDLTEGTDVQLQGLRVGRVKGIALQRDGVSYRFLATLALRTDIVLWKGTRAVAVAKPLGGAFVDLQLPPPGQRLEALPPGSRLEGASTASLVALLESGGRLINNLDGLVADVRHQFNTKGAGMLLDDPRIGRLLAQLEETLAIYKKLGQDGQAIAQHGDGTLKAADRSLASLERNLATVQGLLDKRAGDLDAIITHLAGSLKESEALLKEARALVAEAGPDAKTVLKALDRNLRSTEELLELIKARPNRIVWGRPGEDEREAAAKRVREAREAQKPK